MTRQPLPPSLSRYTLVKAAAKRARQLHAGAPALGVSPSSKPCRIAEDEVRAGRVLRHGVSH